MLSKFFKEVVLFSIMQEDVFVTGLVKIPYNY